MGRSDRIAGLHDLQQLFRWACVLLGNSLDLNIVVFVLHNIQDVFIIQQVEASPRIYLKKANRDVKVAFCECKQFFD